MDKKETFTAAIKENEALLFKIASFYTNNPEDKMDLLQEIIYQLWKSYDGFNQASSLSTWMYRVALNVSIYQLKISKKRILTEPLSSHLSNFSETDNKEIEEKWLLFRQQIEKLNLFERGIILLYLENKSHAEIAAIIGISVSNVGTRIARIKEKLKNQILKKV